MKTLIINAICLLSLFSSSVFAEETHAYQVQKLTVLNIDASINPAIYNYLENNTKKLSRAAGDLLLIKLDTPGGLVSTTKEILTLLGSKDFPVVVWVTPEGASATSAGAIIASSAHLLFMSQGTNIGAATPIGLGKDIKNKDSRSKSINDLVALVRSLSKSRDRNADEFEKMISQAKSIGAKDALKLKAINGIINTERELLERLNDFTVNILGKKSKLQTTNQTTIKAIKMDVGQQILNIFANPTTAYILFIIGAALIYFELQAPGGFIAGSLGAICLLLAGIGFQILPINIGALGLIILSFALFVLEVYITSFGIITIAGLISLIFGSLFLFRTDNSFIDLEKSLIFSVAGIIALYVIGLGLFLLKTYKKTKDEFSQTGRIGIVLKVISPQKYQIKVNGEIWSAQSSQELEVGEKIKITEQNELILSIEKSN